MEQQKLFDLSEFRADIGQNFPQFEDLAVQLLKLALKQGKSVIELGRLVHQLRDKFTVEVFERFVKVKQLPATYLMKCVDLYKSFVDVPIPENMSLRTLQMIAAVPRETEDWDQVIGMIKDGVTPNQIEEWLLKNRAKFQARQRSFIPENEQDVVATLRQILSEEGHKIRGEVNLPSGLRADLVTEKDKIIYVWECKHKLDLKTLQRAQGQTEQYSWDFSGKPVVRGIAYGMVDDTAREMAIEASKHGIKMRLLYVK